MQVKICGITNESDAHVCEKEGAHALGFIFYSGSPRYIAPEKAGEIVASLSVFTAKVGVFVHSTASEISRIAKKAGLTAAQLHGDNQDDIASQLEIPAIKTLRVKSASVFLNCDVSSGDRLLLDTYSDNEYGGTGTSFSWDLIPESMRNHIILAGGVGAHNIRDIYAHIRPAAVDLSSSLETHPGKKDHDKVRHFFSIMNRLKCEGIT
jgi:phosphoribosylanthranilate isomerase